MVQTVPKGTVKVEFRYELHQKVQLRCGSGTNCTKRYNKGTVKVQFGMEIDLKIGSPRNSLN